MKTIKSVSGKAIPLALDNVDTDMIIPATYLTSTEATGYGKHVFQRLRDQDANFVFNQSAFKDANILISQHSFGCGSSREHAVWALLEAGIEAVVAISFADIFKNNSAQNGLVLITLPEEQIFSMLSFAKKAEYHLTIDVCEKTITSSQDEHMDFSLDPFYQYCLVNGLDHLDYLLNHEEIISHFKQTQQNRVHIRIPEK